MKKVVVGGFAVVLAVLGASQTWAHGGGGMGGMTEGDVCARKKGQYLIHFSAYQRSVGSASLRAQLQELKRTDVQRYVDALKEEFRSFCRDIPSTGKVTLTFDLVSDAFRRIPVAVRVVEAVERDRAETVLYIPQHVYPSGVVRVETEFPKAGTYRAIVGVEEHAGKAAEEEIVAHRTHHASAAEAEAYHAHDAVFSFPFTVGRGASRGGVAAIVRRPAILATTIAGMAIGAVLYVRRKKKTT